MLLNKLLNGTVKFGNLGFTDDTLAANEVGALDSTKRSATVIVPDAARFGARFFLRLGPVTTSAAVLAILTIVLIARAGFLLRGPGFGSIPTSRGAGG
jgi:hypothetical protein